jgi:hypothetical protein
MKDSQYLEEWIDGTTVCRQSTTNGFVGSLYESCLQLFASLVPLTTKLTPQSSVRVILKEELARLLSWGDGFTDGELDRTLEKNPELRSTSLEYLSGIGTTLAYSKLTSSIYSSFAKKFYQGSLRT